MERYSLLQSLRVYWLNHLAIFLTPTFSILSASIVTLLAPIVFLSLGIFATVVSYHFGKAPVSHLLTCQLVFALGGFFTALTLLGL